jgi:hypothetical protein
MKVLGMVRWRKHEFCSSEDDDMLPAGATLLFALFLLAAQGALNGLEQPVRAERF